MLPESLSIKEIIYLLAVKNKNGRVSGKHENYHFGIIGAALIELTTSGHVDVEQRKLRVKNENSTNNPALDYILQKVSKRNKPRKVKNWVSAFNNHFSRIRNPIREQLYQKGYLSREQKSFLGLIPYWLHPVVKADEKQKMSDYLHDIILTKNEYSDKEAAVISMLYLSGVFRTIFSDKNERKQARNKIKKQIKEGTISSAVSESIKEMQAAMIAAVTAATVATAAAGASSN